MKLNSTVALTSILSIMMLGAGTASALWGFTIGREALKGVTQPDVNPAKKLKKGEQASEQPKEFTPVKEKDILAKVETYLKRKNQKPKPETPKKAQGVKDSAQSNQEQTKQQSSQGNTQKVNFPLKVEDQGVILEIVKATQQGGSLLLELNLSNQGAKPIRFLYSFLDVKDSQGHSLSAITDGLPGELPANGEKFAGTVKIPTGSSSEAQKISLSLTDYPEQKLKLNISDIAVAR